MWSLFMQILTAWLGLATSYVLFHSPKGLRVAVANFLAFLWFDLLRIRRRVVLDNLAIAFPNMSLRERTRLGRKSIQHLGLNLLEYSFLPWLTKDNFNKFFVFENKALLDDAHARGKGVLLITLRLGNGDLACAGLSLTGSPVVMVSKFFKLKWLNDMWFGMRERLGTRFIAPRDSSFAFLRALKSKAIIVIPLDQFTGPPIGVRTSFFGRETGTAAGPAVMAERSGAPVLAVYTYRATDGRHVLRIEREIPVTPSSSPLKVNELTQKFNDQLETFVRLHPEQWMWIHRRWKTYQVT
jgi:KDO2-lipid IV(A) lauroyltransferase